VLAGFGQAVGKGSKTAKGAGLPTAHHLSSSFIYYIILIGACMTVSVSKPLLDVLKGKIAEVPPIWLMRQAGRYLPEYRELRAQKGGFLELAYESDAAAEITLQPIRRFGFDGSVV
jgi:hypothetical protein